MINQTINETINQTLMFAGQTFPMTSSPTFDIYVITIVASLFITLVNKKMSDQVRIKALRVEMKEIQKQMRKHMTKNPEKAKQLQKEIMKKNMENMKHAMNPKIIIITMLPMIALFAFVGKYYSQFGEFFNFLGLTTFGWLGTYIVFSLINSILLKKLLKVA